MPITLTRLRQRDNGVEVECLDNEGRARHLWYPEQTTPVLIRDIADVVSWAQDAVDASTPGKEETEQVRDDSLNYLFGDGWPAFSAWLEQESNRSDVFKVRRPLENLADEYSREKSAGNLGTRKV